MMRWPVEPISVEQSGLYLKTLEEEDLPSAAEALNDPDGYFAEVAGIDCPAKIVEMLGSNLVQYRLGKVYPFVCSHIGEVVATTRFLRFDDFRGSLEIGGTWIAPRWRRTFVNTQFKLMLIDLAFSRFDVERIEFTVCDINFRSQIAVLRLGATFEGILKRARVYPDGRSYDYRLYSILKPDWPSLRETLKDRLKRLPIADRMPRNFKAAELAVRRLSLNDSSELLQVFVRNRSSIERSFKGAYDLGQVDRYIADFEQRSASGEAYLFGVFRSGSLVGLLHIKSVDWQLRAAELGYFIDVSHQRCGTARAVIQSAQEELMKRGFTRIFARVLTDNIANQRLLESIGFLREGTHALAYRNTLGEVLDVFVYAKTTSRVT